MAMQFDSKTFNNEAFGKYIETLPNPNKDELIKSGALVASAEIKNLLSSQTGSYYAKIPMYGRIGGAAVNYDGGTNITSSNMETFTRGVQAFGRAAAWTEKDFSVDITAGVDYMSEIAKQVAEYKDDLNTEVLMSILKGIFAMSDDEGKKFVEAHTHDITAEIDAEVTAASLNTAIQKACGDKKQKFSLVIMHSAVATNLENLNLLNYLKYTDANGVQRDLAMATWNGKTVLIDDGMPTEAAADHTKYTTYVFGQGAIEYADLGAKVPYEMSRDPKTNGGEDTLYWRERICYAPKGFDFIGTPASLSPTNAEFEDGANWGLASNGKSGGEKKVYNHKDIAIARIISRG